MGRARLLNNVGAHRGIYLCVGVQWTLTLTRGAVDTDAGCSDLMQDAGCSGYDAAELEGYMTSRATVLRPTCVHARLLLGKGLIHFSEGGAVCLHTPPTKLTFVTFDLCDLLGEGILTRFISKINSSRNFDE